MNYTEKEIESQLTTRTFTQVTATIPRKAFEKLIKSHWLETSSLQIDKLEEKEDFVMVKIYGHGLGKNLFQKKLVVTLTMALTN
jgi:hypothetical protein